MNKPSRRAVVRTGVWAVPVVTTVGLAPFAAASVPSDCTTDVCIDNVGTGCKLPGHSTDTFYGYRMLVTFVNCTKIDQTVIISDTGFTIDGKPLVEPFSAHNPTTIVVPGTCPDTTDPDPKAICVQDGDCVRYTLAFVVKSSSSSQREATITYTVNGITQATPVFFPKFNPCDCNGGDPSDAHTDCGK